MLNFLGIGAQKAGSTWLWKWLRRHPEIWLPNRKELHFWDHRFYPKSTWGRGFGWYEKKFRGDRVCKGEITPSYSMLDPEDISQIEEHYPGFKAILVLRNPVVRSLSAARMRFGQKRVPRSSVCEAEWKRVLDRPAVRERSSYPKMIKTWRRSIGEDRLLLLKFEALREDPVEFLEQCEDFLLGHKGFYRSHGPVRRGLRSKVNRTGGYAVPEEVLRHLLERHREEIWETMALTGWDLSPWIDSIEKRIGVA